MKRENARVELNPEYKNTRVNQVSRLSRWVLYYFTLFNSSNVKNGDQGESSCERPILY